MSNRIWYISNSGITTPDIESALKADMDGLAHLMGSGQLEILQDRLDTTQKFVAMLACNLLENGVVSVGDLSNMLSNGTFKEETS